MKKKSFTLNFADSNEQVVIPETSFDYAMSTDEGTMVSVTGDRMFVKETLAEVANLYEETSDKLGIFEE